MRSTRKFLYDVRWVFHYETTSVRGTWGKASKEARASDMPREGLVSVSIEANDKIKNKMVEFFNTPADDFLRFEWIVTTNIPAVQLQKLDGTLKLKPFHEGLTVVTKDGSKFTFYIDGKIEKTQGRV